MPTPRDAETENDREQRLLRLGQAMDAFLRFRRGDAGADRERFLRDHENLRDLLEPMFDDGGDAATDSAAGDTDPQQAFQPAPGRQLGDYRLVREIGRGGMGVVWEAEQISLRRRVALKLLPEHLSQSPQSIERFRREAAAASRLRHPGLVPIHEVGEWHGVHFFSMEFVEGRTLHVVMQQERFGVRADCSRTAEAAEVTARLADALHHAHEHGLVHRDVKPHNVMVGHDGSVRLLDFGLAKDLDARTQSGGAEFFGTPHYCSPEQITGQTTIGPAADVFSLGIVLYELLARRRPFDGESSRIVLRRIETGEFPSLRSVAPSVPRDLQTICHKALEPRPQDRYPTAGAFAADLRRFLRIEPIHASAPNVVTRSIKWVRRHHLRVALGATLGLTIVGAPLAYALHLQDTNAAIERERVVLDRAEDLGFRSIEQTLALLAEQLERQPGPGSRHEPRVDAVVALCRSFLDLRSDQPQRRTRIADAMFAIAGIWGNLGRTDAALDACAQSRQLLLAQGPVDAMDTQLRLGRILQRELFVRQMAEPNAGAVEFRSALAHWDALVARPDAPQTALVERAALLLVRASALAEQPDRHFESERLLLQTKAALTPELCEQDRQARTIAARCDAVLGQVLLASHRTEPALELLRSAVARLAALPGDPSLAVVRAEAVAATATALVRLERIDEAAAAAQSALTTTTAWLREFPGSRQLRRTQVASRLVLGTLLLVQGKFEAAEAALRDAATDAEAMHATTVTERSLLAQLDVQLADCILMHRSSASAHAEATTLMQRGADRLQELVDEHPKLLELRIDLAVAWNSLASLANERDDAANAVTFAEKAIVQQEAALRVMPGNRRARQLLGIHQSHLAHGQARLGRSAEAVAAATAAIANAPGKVATLRLAAGAASRAAELVLVDESLSAEARRLRAEGYGLVAMDGLQRIAELDREEALRLVGHDRFAALRERPDFTTLRERLEDR